MAVISDRGESGRTTRLAENSRMFGWVKRHRDYVRLIERQAAEMICTEPKPTKRLVRKERQREIRATPPPPGVFAASRPRLLALNEYRRPILRSCFIIEGGGDSKFDRPTMV
jgi:hypothetical protein